MITYYFRSVKEEGLQTLTEPKPGTWVHVENPTDEELEVLSSKFGLDSDLLRDAVDFYEVPRFEYEDNIVYLYTRFPHETDGEIGTAPMLLAVTENAVVSVSREHPTFLNKYLEGKTVLYTTQRTKLFLQLMGGVHSWYKGHLIGIRREVQRSRVNLRDIKNRDIVRLVALEGTLNDFLSALVPTQAALGTILSGKHLTRYEEDLDMIEDIQLENAQLVESAKANLKTMQNIRSAYTAIVTNNLNQVIKFLTSLTIILTLPTLVGSLYGMNVPLPLAEYRHAFIAILTITLGGMAVVTYFFRRKEWL